jgi:hypothetical protein
MGKKAAKRRQISFSLSEDLVEEIEKLAEDTGLSLNAIVNLRLKGYNVVKENGCI